MNERRKVSPSEIRDLVDDIENSFYKHCSVHAMSTRSQSTVPSSQPSTRYEEFNEIVREAEEQSQSRDVYPASSQGSVSSVSTVASCATKSARYYDVLIPD
jgi:hypothetical protein